ncbi:MAG: hypothetical protein LC737_07100 [Chloroflexi bacterium]|nr:hypothetical protein [Chloroflexota bacterium]
MSQLTSDNLRNFLLKLAEDPALVQQLQADPQGVMSAAGLSESEKQLVLSGDRKALEDAMYDSSIQGYKPPEPDTQVVVVLNG